MTTAHVSCVKLFVDDIVHGINERNTCSSLASKVLVFWANINCNLQAYKKRVLLLIKLLFLNSSLGVLQLSCLWHFLDHARALIHLDFTHY